MKVKNANNFQLDVSKLLEKFKEQYKNIYIYQFEDQVFIYRAVGRKEYTDLALNENISQEDKEEEICRICTLFPKDFDFENCDEAGLPSKLCGEIIENSYLSKENRDKVLAYFRHEMYNLDNQINCMICAAFPNLKLEEVENFDVVTANKYFSRAEWILTNIGGVPLREKDPGSDYVYQKEKAVTEEIRDNDTIESSAPKKKVAHNGKEKMTPEKLAELKAKFPEIDWEHDRGLMGIDGIKNSMPFDNTPPALRPRSRAPKKINPPPSAPYMGKPDNE